MYQKVINKRTERLLATLAKSSLIKDFYLGGGTALALQCGHRKSVDLRIDKIVIDSEEKNTLNSVLAGVKLSFFSYPYRLLFPLLKWNGIKIADWRDIACMKLDAVSSRGSKKDFIDLYFILHKLSLDELLKLFEKKYKNIEFNKLHILKSLVYFVDADNEPMPVMLKDIEWQKIKNYFQKLTEKEV